MVLSELVRRRRVERGLSLRQVAATAKMSLSGVHGLESGSSKDPATSTILGLAKALKLKPDIVFAAARESLEGNPNALAAEESDDPEPVGAD